MRAPFAFLVLVLVFWFFGFGVLVLVFWFWFWFWFWPFGFFAGGGWGVLLVWLFLGWRAWPVFTLVRLDRPCAGPHLLFFARVRVAWNFADANWPALARKVGFVTDGVQRAKSAER
ncbi:hypothetical protein [Paraburkholderia sp.]|uniref:hypothetical protein n=1 Tax=Paraburkholderia sp. TaxID=1926495 RepID=UPI00239E7DDF|nr:hypothetical protein [Paraburkholderia sp.]MDE1182214.1 hypothetical protein [Paraburkholderia sp.]